MQTKARAWKRRKRRPEILSCSKHCWHWQHAEGYLKSILLNYALRVSGFVMGVLSKEARFLRRQAAHATCSRSKYFHNSHLCTQRPSIIQSFQPFCPSAATDRHDGASSTTDDDLTSVIIGGPDCMTVIEPCYLHIDATSPLRRVWMFYYCPPGPRGEISKIFRRCSCNLL